MTSQTSVPETQYYQNPIRRALHEAIDKLSEVQETIQSFSDSNPENSDYSNLAEILDQAINDLAWQDKVIVDGSSEAPYLEDIA